MSLQQFRQTVPVTRTVRGLSAPLRRNITIIENADLVVAFWDMESRGTKFVIDQCRLRGIPVRVYTGRPGK